MIADTDLSLIYATDSVEEAIAHRIFKPKQSNHSGSNASRARDVDAPSHGSASAGYAEGYGNQVAAIDPFGFAQGRLSIVRGKALGSRARCPQLAVKQTIRRLEFTFFRELPSAISV